MEKVIPEGLPLKPTTVKQKKQMPASIPGIMIFIQNKKF